MNMTNCVLECVHACMHVSGGVCAFIVWWSAVFLRVNFDCNLPLQCCSTLSIVRKRWTNLETTGQMCKQDAGACLLIVSSIEFFYSTVAFPDIFLFLLHGASFFLTHEALLCFWKALTSTCSTLYRLFPNYTHRHLLMIQPCPHPHMFSAVWHLVHRPHYLRFKSYTVYTHMYIHLFF